jgi:hypothetical protein
VDSSLAILLANAGIAGIFCVLFITGVIYPRSVVSDLKTENAELKRQLEAERDRAATAVAGIAATTDVVRAIQAGIHLGTRQE